MTLRHLVIFKAVFEELHFTRAAERLYLTQSAVSHAIKDLEEETGTVLFERRGAGDDANIVCCPLWEQAAGIVEQYERLSKNMNTFSRKRRCALLPALPWPAIGCPGFCTLLLGNCLKYR